MRSNTDSYVHLTEGRQPVEDGRNRIYYCELSRYYSKNVFRDFSIKFTLEGAVQYQTEKDNYQLLPNYFLLSSKQPCECVVESKNLTRNISIDLSDSTMNETFTVLMGEKEIDLDNLEAAHFITPPFFEFLHPIDHSDLGVYLRELGLKLTHAQQTSIPVSEETFYTLAEKVISHEKSIHHSLRQLDAVKSSTRNETLRRLLIGKYFMDAHFLSDLSIPQIAQQAHLSQYYFFRNFKKAFSCTPYQYLLEKRLEHARHLLIKNEYIQDVADTCGFPDSFSFSKAFKKKYGYTPSSIKKTLSQ